MTVLTLEQVLEDIINSPVEPEAEGLIEKIDKIKDMLLIKSRFYRIDAEYQELLSENKDYRKLVKEYLWLNPSYEHFGECLEEARAILFMVEDGSIEMSDVFGLIRKIKGFRFKNKSKQGELYSFTKEIVRTFLERCKNRNEFYTRLDELEELVGVYGLGTDFMTKFETEVKVEKRVTISFHDFGEAVEKMEKEQEEFHERFQREKEKAVAKLDRYKEIKRFYE